MGDVSTRADVSTVRAGVLNITAYRGDTFSLGLLIKEKLTNVPIDITGFLFKMLVRTKIANTGTSILSFDNDEGIDIVDAAAGSILLHKTAAQMSISPGTYYYDLQYTKPSGEVVTFLAGTFTIQQEITT